MAAAAFHIDTPQASSLQMDCLTEAVAVAVAAMMGSPGKSARSSPRVR